jgi:hypothetical protein
MDCWPSRLNINFAVTFSGPVALSDEDVIKLDDRYPTLGTALFHGYGRR